MGRRMLVVVLGIAFGIQASAKEVYLSIAGSVGVFRTDARIFNPSATKDIQIEASFLPVGNGDNTSAQRLTITVPKRQMVVYDDIVTSLFHSTGLGAVRLSSGDDFVATQRIYARVSNGTLGQFVPGLETASARRNGVLIQMKSGNGFRTNVGVVNPNAVAANVTWHLHDRNNALVARGNPIVMPPFAVIAPTNVAGQFFFDPAGADLTDAWVSYTSDQPVFAYASVVDNGTTDPTFVPMFEDTGADPAPPEPEPEPEPQAKVFDVTLRSFSIDVVPDLSGLKVGDVIKLHVHAEDPGHGFTLSDPTGKTVIADRSGFGGFPVGAEFEQTFTITTAGRFNFFCTHPTCGGGHNSMVGSFDATP